MYLNQESGCKRAYTDQLCSGGRKSELLHNRWQEECEAKKRSSNTEHLNKDESNVDRDERTEDLLHAESRFGGQARSLSCQAGHNDTSQQSQPQR